MMDSQNVPFSIPEVKSLLYQLVSAIAHLHSNWIIHRDLKTSNLLISKEGVLKVGDFGLAREYGSPLRQMTPLVVTLWYRSPELLLQAEKYSFPVDNWSIGCIFAELILFKPLFQGKSEIEQLNLIFKELGTPSEKIWPGYEKLPVVQKVQFAEYPYNSLHNRLGRRLGEAGFSLINRFLTYYPEKRITAEAALEDPFFDSILPRIFTPEQLYKNTGAAASSSFIGR